MPDALPDSPASPRGRFKKLLDDFETYVESEKENGARTLPATPALVAALGDPLPPPPATGLAAIAEAVHACTACPLHKTRTHAMPGQGNPRPELLFVNERPGFEDEADQLLTKMIEAMGITRDQVFIAHIVKCPPPGNREPTPAEAAACLHFLKDQITLLQPKVIVSLGATALQYLMAGNRAPLPRKRGHWLTYEGIALMPTFNPSFLLQNPSQKKHAWEDLKAVLTKLGRTPPAVKKRAAARS